MCRRVSFSHRVVLLGALFLSHGGAVMSSRRVEVPGVGDPTIRADEGRLLQNNTEDEKDAVELPSCNDVLLHESIDDRCHHALNCEGESLMTFLLPLAFCTDPLESHPLILIFWPIIFFLLLSVFVLLLFRLLGSTAENYFSPALEMLSSEFQIVSGNCSSQCDDEYYDYMNTESNIFPNICSHLLWQESPFWP